MEFDWDDANISHIANHSLETEDAEDAVLDENALDFPAHRGPQGQRRVGVIGKTLMSKIIVVILEEREDKFRVVTARPATKKEQSLYDKTS